MPQLLERISYLKTHYYAHFQGVETLIETLKVISDSKGGNPHSWCLLTRHEFSKKDGNCSPKLI